MDRWQTIDTAPKNKPILCWTKTGPTIAFWRASYHCWASIPGIYTIHPTHWIPLPAAPKET